MTSLTTCADAESACRRAATEIARRLHSARAERGVAHLALSGGDAPARAYELLGPALESWQGIELWFADERCVSAQDELSNYRLVSETLLCNASAVAERSVHRMQGELGAEQGAGRYADALREIAEPHRLPEIDLVVLGIGPDGHIASLFPGASTLDAGEHDLCLGVLDSPKPPPQRITLTLPVLRSARWCLLLATGPGKADAISAMLGEPTRHVPASLLRRGRLGVIADDAASPTPILG
jgi:6-phosphogluconolactonase